MTVHRPVQTHGPDYKGQRAAFIRFLEHAKPIPTSQDHSVEAAIGFLLDHRTHRHPKLAVVRDEGRGRERVAVDLASTCRSCRTNGGRSFAGQRGREPAPREVDRRYFELCLFTQVVNELKSGDPVCPARTTTATIAISACLKP